MNFSNKISDLKKSHLLRSRKITQSAQGTEMKIDNQDVVNFCSNDYLSLANHPKIKEALIKGVEKYGAGSGASHLVSGHSESHKFLEETLAEFTGQQSALLFSSGYSANLGVFSALRDEINWSLQDKLNHASLIDGSRLIGLPVQRYLHNNIESLEKKISKQTGPGLVVTDNVFSMDGDKANVSGIAEIIKKTNTIFMQDDAHGFGIFDPIIPHQSIYMATLGKSAGVMGAFVAGDDDFIEYTYPGNKYFLINAIQYLCDETGISILRSKELKLRMLNKKTISNYGYLIQLINIILPLFILLIFAIVNTYYQKKKYA